MFFVVNLSDVRVMLLILGDDTLFFDSKLLAACTFDDLSVSGWMSVFYNGFEDCNGHGDTEIIARVAIIVDQELLAS